MKTLAKRISIMILIIIAGIGSIIGYFYIQAKPYITATNTDIQLAISRSIKSSLRSMINQTANASLIQILQAAYNTLHIYNSKRIQNSTQTTWEHSIQHTTSIIDIAIPLPSMLTSEIQIDTTKENIIIFSYNEHFLGSITVYTEQDRQTQEEEGLFNQEKIAEQSGYILAYAQVLDNPFEGIELETFGEIAQAFNTAVGKTQILNIIEIKTIVAYITQIDSDTTTITLDPITILTGEKAALALAEREPEVCQSILSGTEATTCTPPNDFYIINEDNDSFEIAMITIEGLQTQINLLDKENGLKPVSVDIQTFTAAKENWENKVFTIRFIQDGILDITEYFLP